MKEASQYKNNVIASSSKCFWATLLDYGLVFVLFFILLYAAGVPIYASLPFTTDLSTTMAACQKESYSIINGTGLSTYKSDDLDQGLYSEEQMCTNYLIRLAKTSYFLSDTPYPNGDGTSKAVEVGDTFLVTEGDSYVEDPKYTHDPLSYYMFTFKGTASELDDYVYGGVDYSNNKAEGLYIGLMGYANLAYFEETPAKGASISKYLVLSEAYADRLVAYLVYEETSGNASETYSNLRNAYLNASNKFIEEVETLYIPYINNREALSSASSTYYSYFFLTAAISYAVAFILLEAIPPIFLKGRTIGLASFRLALTATDETVPSWKRRVVRSFFRFLIYSSSISLGLFFIDSNALGLLFMNLGGGFSFVFVVAFSFLLGLASLILSLARKEHQGLGDWAAGIYIKDTEISEAGTPLEERIHADAE